MKRIGIGLIGCGGIAQRAHLPAIRAVAEANLVGVCDIVDEVAEKTGKAHKVSYTTEYLSLLERKDIEAVIVAVPHKYHKEITVEACKHKKHVLCEKPLGITLEECDTMIQAAEKGKVVLMTAENYLFDPALRLISDFVDNDVLGKVRLINLEQVGFYKGYSWRRVKDVAGGGILMDDGVHLFALALKWAGAVESMFAKMETYRPELEGKKIDVEDNGHVIMEHSNGVLTTVDTSGVNRFPHFAFEVNGDKGGVLYQWVVGSPWSKYQPEMRIAGFEHDLPEFPKWFPSMESYRDELKHFLECIANDKRPHTDGSLGKESLRLVLKAYESGSRKQEVNLD